MDAVSGIEDAEIYIPCLPCPVLDFIASRSRKTEGKDQRGEMQADITPTFIWFLCIDLLKSLFEKHFLSINILTINLDSE